MQELDTAECKSHSFYAQVVESNLILSDDSGSVFVSLFFYSELLCA